MEKIILYFGQDAKVACDEKCNKAWGVSSRPCESLSDDPDDIVWLSDSELGDAPENPGTYEGGHGKPTSLEQAPNKWCVRQCERCAISKIGQSGEPLALKDWSARAFNIEK